jgi:isopenicillin-N epimerase
VDEAAVMLAANDDESVAAILDGVRGGTRHAVLDHVSFATAEFLPIEQFAAASHEQGAQVIFNAAHSPGSVPAEVGTLDDDFRIGNIHNWVGVPRSTARVLASSERCIGLKPFPLSSRESEGLLHAFGHVGAPGQTTWLAAPVGIESFDGFGWDAVRRRNNALARSDQLLIVEAIGASPEGVSGDDAGEYARPIRLIPPDIAPGDGSGDVCTALTDRPALEHAVGCPTAARSRRALLRVCVQSGNGQAGCERLADALNELL